MLSLDGDAAAPPRRPTGDALLHGRGVARAQGARPGAGAGDGARGEDARPRGLLHARDAEGRQAEQLRDAGLDYYNHNLDTAPEHYGA
jgi:hypothetical protein